MPTMPIPIRTMEAGSGVLRFAAAQDAGALGLCNLRVVRVRPGVDGDLSARIRFGKESAGKVEIVPS